MCIGLVCTPEGLPLSFEVFAGNRTDVTTVEEIVTKMEEKYGQAQRVWVMDRGMVSEKNIAFLRARNARYLVGTPKSQLKEFEKHRHIAELLTRLGLELPRRKRILPACPRPTAQPGAAADGKM